MTETPANTPEPAATPPTPTALAAKALMARIDNPTHRGIIETKAVLGGWVGSREAGCWNTHLSDAIAKAALDAVFDRFREWAAECGDMEPLDGALVPYLDWPVWMRENGVTCERPDCTHEDCQYGPVQVSEMGHTTVRAILAGIKAHAEETPEGGHA